MTDLPFTAVTRRAAAAGPRTSWRGWLLNVLIAAAALLAGVGLGEWLLPWGAPPPPVLKRAGVWAPPASVRAGHPAKPSTPHNTRERAHPFCTDPAGLS